MKKFLFDDKRKMIRTYVDLYSSLGVPENLRLTPKEKLYFIEMVVLYSQGEDLNSKKTLTHMQDLGFKNKSVYIYRSKLEEKGWIINQDGIELHKPFQFGAGIPDEISFKFMLEYDNKENTRRRDQVLSGERSESEVYNYES